LLIVSDILLHRNPLRVVSSEDYLRSKLEEPIINIQLDYRYMKMGYYVSTHAEANGNQVIPTSTDIIDAYNNAIFLMRSEKRGIPTPAYVATNSVEGITAKLGFPLILFPLNPFSYDTYRIARSSEELTKAVKNLGMNRSYPVSAQTLLGPIQTVKSIFGSVQIKEADSAAKKCYEEFMIPLCKLYIQRTEEKCYLCSMAPLRPSDMKPADLQIISEKIEDMRNNP